MNAPPPLSELLARASAAPGALSAPELARLVSLEAPEDRAALRSAAHAVKLRVSGARVFLRGLLEIGNVCAKNCLYCGLRRDNAAVRRYAIPEEDVVRMALAVHSAGYGSVVLQSGEIESEANTERMERIVRAIRSGTSPDFAIVLSLGEQTDEVFARWREAGADRYLLRIECANPRLYRAIHPEGHSWERRRDCLLALRRLGYQLGTGVMFGLPGETPEDLASDIRFFRDIGADMIGMGPFVPNPETPMAGAPFDPAAALELALDMVAATRLHLHDCNIAATTALQVLAPDGRERAILAGANVMMPNATDLKYRRDYQLYKGKPCLDEDAGRCRACLSARVARIGEAIAWGNPGTPPHYLARTSK